MPDSHVAHRVMKRERSVKNWTEAKIHLMVREHCVSFLLLIDI